MTNETTRPDYLEVAGHFANDAVDFELRYRYCAASDGPLFLFPRSRRLKTFLDLRMGIESILKCLVVLYKHENRGGERLVNWVEKFGHKTEKLLQTIEPYLPKDVLTKHGQYLEHLKELPVGLRYRLDAWDFRENKKELYCQTVGSDVWLNKLHESLVCLIEQARKELPKNIKVVGIEELITEIMEPRHKKYT